MLRRLLSAAAMVVVVPFLTMLAPNGAHAAASVVCTGDVAVTSFAFSPASVPLGSTSDLTMVLQNCTNQAIQGTTVWNGTYAGQGCPALDGPLQSYTIAPNGTVTISNSYGDGGFVGCQPTALRINANVSVNGIGTEVGATATLQFTAACTNGITINQFSFSPATVAVGQVSTLTLVLRNCGTLAVQGSSIWAPEFTWSGTGLPPGCVVMDPLAFSYSLAPGATFTQTLGLDDPIASCQATGIQATVDVSVNGVTGTAATATANLVITGSGTGATCHVTYTPNSWQGGFTANVTITNNGTLAINSWTLTFAFPGDQKITNAWNASVTQTGANVTATNLSYNTTIPPGGSQSFGFQGMWTTNDTSPASFSLNGTTCT